ncbi:capsular biosynthesis protein [Tolypothrix campylonemoides VB511288]|nr:capsular biosynthesis protein [Tolypothrix campylonemoides VB511288]
MSVAALAACSGQYLAPRDNPQPDLIDSGQVQVVPITTEVVAGLRGQTATVPQELASYQPQGYQVRPGDTLLVTVWDHPELTTPAGTQQQTIANGRLVQSDGTMYFPHAGKMQVAGKTLEEVRDMLTSRLGRVLQQPQVDVNIANFAGQVALEGAFANAAPQQITTVPLTLAQAVGRAGIDAQNADASGLTLIRDGRSYPVDIDALNRNGRVAPEIYLKPGDRLYMPYNDRKQVYVLGEVVRPQAISFRTSDMTLTQAIGRVGGLNPITANGKAVYVIRGLQQIEDGQGAQATVYQLDARSPAAFVLSNQFPVRAGDVVFVGPAGITRWNRFLSQLLPLSGLVSNIANAQYDFGNN